MIDAVPHFTWGPSGQLRVWCAGEGPPLLVLPGLLRSPADRAAETAEACPGWTAIAIELPGLGASEAVGGDLQVAVAAVGGWLSALGREVSLVAYDFGVTAATILMARGAPIVRVAWLEAAGYTTAVEAGTTAPTLTFADDGSHLTRLWQHLRDRDMLDPTDSLRARSTGAPYATAEQLDAALLCFGENPPAYESLWNQSVSTGLPMKNFVERLRRCDSPNAAAEWIGISPEGEVPALPQPPASTRRVLREYVDVARGRVHLRRAGNGDRLLLAFLAGAGSSANLMPLLEGLAGSFTVVAPDYIGQGDSCRAPAPTTVAQLAVDAAEVANALGFDKIDAYGTHTGAGVAIELAIAFPKRVGHVIVDGINMESKADRAEHRARYFPDVVPDAWGSHVFKVWNVRRDGGYFWPWFRPEPRAARTGRAPSLPLLHDRVISTLRSRTTPAYQAIAEYEARMRLPLLTCPTLFVAGPKDTFVTHLDAARSVAPPNVHFESVPATVWFAGQSHDAVTKTLSRFAEFLLDEN